MKINKPFKSIILLSFLLLFAFSIQSQITLPSIFGDHMVLQQKQENPVWGWARPNDKITISIHGQSHKTYADENGYWKIVLKPIEAGGPYKMNIKGQYNSFFLKDVMVGEVWVCSGQSNMYWQLQNTNSGKLSILTANNPNIRMINVPRVASTIPQKDFDGAWQLSSPASVGEFSAIAYHFGQNLQAALGVPVGLIHNSWGGSAAEAWVSKDVLSNDPKYDKLMKQWEDIAKNYNLEKEINKWESEGRKGRKPRDLLNGNQRPANIYNGVLHPTIGYGMKGVIWYQGESNASRAYQYRDLFPLMIQNWRDEWQQGDFPFYYVQLADFKAEKAEPAESDWAELREAQAMTQKKLNNVAQAVIIDLGEGRDIHPRSKRTVADRLARIALAKDYSKDILYSGPTFKLMEIEGSKAILTFDNVGKRGLYAFDEADPIGFSIAGADKKFKWAKAKIISNNQIEVSNQDILNPVAVRYAWADNPVCNMYNQEGLPMTPFRTDNWKGISHEKVVR